MPHGSDGSDAKSDDGSEGGGSDISPLGGFDGSGSGSLAGAARAVLRQQLRALKRTKMKPNKVADQLTYAYEFRKHVTAVNNSGEEADGGNKNTRRLNRWVVAVRKALPPFLRSSVVGLATFTAYDVNKDLYKRYCLPESSSRSGISDSIFAATNGLACGFVGGFLQLLLEGKIVSLRSPGQPSLTPHMRLTMSTSMITFSVLFGSYEATKHIFSCSSRGTADRASDAGLARYYMLIAGAGGIAGLVSETAVYVYVERPAARTVLRLWRTPSFMLSAVVPSLLGFVAYEFDED